ncbi:hypothetical protein COLU111180_01075 [Cohnella lubricantis]|uniref:Uncharacterized protein n=1 Tax=Cohnella lubricantis TaxID=2163172 RepID=A0A841TKT0_9BACL|nr:hypothetical protein [Cohnella lubricantis]MBB6679800.1 hypothetical protein [Cohnella lubricantis]MBP2120263.1 hypothetical protein [Cohnella lubricantis]
MSKSIVEKLNLHQFNRIAVLQQPEHDDRLAGLAAYDTELKDGSYDLIFAYALDLESMQTVVREVIDRSCLTEGGYLYAAYPKKGNKAYPTYIHRDSLLAGAAIGVL